MTKAEFTTKLPAAGKGRGKRPRPEQRQPLVDFLRSLDLGGLDLTRERDTGRD